MANYDEIVAKKEGPSGVPGMMRVRGGTPVPPDEEDPLDTSLRMRKRLLGQRIEEQTMDQVEQEMETQRVKTQAQAEQAQVDLERSKLDLAKMRADAAPKADGEGKYVDLLVGDLHDRLKGAEAETKELRDRQYAGLEKEMSALRERWEADKADLIKAIQSPQQSPVDELVRMTQSVLQARERILQLQPQTPVPLSDLQAALEMRKQDIELKRRELEIKADTDRLSAEAENAREERRQRLDVEREKLEEEKRRNNMNAKALEDLLPAVQAIAMQVVAPQAAAGGAAPASTAQALTAATQPVSCPSCHLVTQISKPAPGTWQCPNCRAMWNLKEVPAAEGVTPSAPSAPALPPGSGSPPAAMPPATRPVPRLSDV